MKKIFLLPLIVLMLTGCGTTSSNEEAHKENESIQLTTSNFSTYVATNSNAVSLGNDSYVRYYTYFIGADNCRFIDCQVTYYYQHATSPIADPTEETIKLSLSGDGEANFFYVRGLYYVLVVKSVKGTVIVY